MGAHLYWFPGKGAPLRDVSIGRLWSSLEITPAERAAVTDSIAGSRTLVRWTSWSQVRVTCDLSYGDSAVVSSGLIQELEALAVHLRAGGTVALAEDDNCTFAGYVTRQPSLGTTSVKLVKNQWRQWSTPDITAGDSIVLRGPSPESLEESCRLSAKSGLTCSLTDPVRYDYTDQPWVFARDSRFWPYLRLQSGARSSPLLRYNRRILYSLDLPLEESLGRFAPPETEWPIPGSNIPTPGRGYDDWKDPGADYELPVLVGRLP